MWFRFTVTEERRDDSVGHLGVGPKVLSDKPQRPVAHRSGHVFLRVLESNMRMETGGSALGGYMPCVPTPAEGSSDPPFRHYSYLWISTLIET